MFVSYGWTTWTLMKLSGQYAMTREGSGTVCDIIILYKCPDIMYNHMDSIWTIWDVMRLIWTQCDVL